MSDVPIYRIPWIREQQKTATRQIQDILDLYRADILILGTETTGLNYEHDEIIQIGVVEYSSGKTLANRYLMPQCDISDGAFEKHGLTKRILKSRNAVTFKALHGNLYNLLKGKIVFGYNLNFDSYFLARHCHVEGLSYFKPNRWQDMMGLFSQIAGRWDSSNSRFSWQKLESFSKNRVAINAHDAVGDCNLVLQQLRKIDRYYKKGNTNA